MTFSVGSSGRLAAALALIAVLAGCSAPVGSGVPSGEPTDGGPETATPAAESGPGVEPNYSVAPRPDPAADVQGWEDGYWYNESLRVTERDGLNESELDAVVARATARVEQVRGVEFDDPVPVTVRDRSAIGDDIGGGGGGGESDAATVAAIRQRALFMVGDERGGDGDDGGSDPGEATRTATVQGYYVPAEDRVVIVTDGERPILDEVTLAQELYHAHQFRNRPLLVPRNFTDDHVVALRALIEGDANVVDRLYERRCESEWDCVRPDGGTAGDGGGSDGGGDADRDDGGFGEEFHVGLYLLSYVPYAEGEPLVADVYEAGGWDAVDDLYRDPPRSSEQVIHPDARGDEAPERVEVPDRSATQWERVTRPNRPDAVTVGEAGLATTFVYTAFDDRAGGLVDPESVLNRRADGRLDPVDPIDYAVNYSTGWAGDGLATYERADGEPGYVWRLRFDDAGEAREFARGYRRLLEYRNGTSEGDVWTLSGPFAGAYWLDVTGRTVTVVHGPSPASLGALWPDAEAPAIEGGPAERA